ncbi:alpha/beta hydrolase family protein [Pseudarthrobacter sp. YS3]|uniref:alpha/beta hydrolase family protein n=1 Tax=Pseudarthrobacter sp. YS3 TaxID=3453718 RepID=UPI003EEF9F1B
MEPVSLTISCDDGYVLRGHLWEPSSSEEGRLGAVVVIAGATGVKATYYHRYAAFLAENGFTSITFDYRGIGQSRESTLKNLPASWYDWALKDLDAVLEWAQINCAEKHLHVVGHSFGGFSVGLARNGRRINRLLTVGAQHAYWRDYRPGHRLGLWWRWHILMPALAIWNGYFPGKRLGWLEDLPKGVAMDWARSPRDFTTGGAGHARELIRAHQASFTAPTLAVAATDDPFATETAVLRGLSYYPNSSAILVQLNPQDFGRAEIGHFSLFHSSFRDTFWMGTIRWLRDGVNPWALK